MLNRNYSTTILTASMVFAIAVIYSGCPRRPPGDTDPLYLETTKTLPAPDPDEMLLATYDSPDGRARISVFPGTTLPGSPITVELVDPSTVPVELRSSENDFALKLGPDGTQFDMPVRVSLLVGEVATDDDGAYIVPNADVFTESAAKAAELVADPQVQVTEDGLLIVHALLEHFSNTVYEMKIGIKLAVKGPRDHGSYEVGKKFRVGMATKNDNEDPVRVQATEKEKAPLAGLKYDHSIKTVPGKTAKVFGKGTCKCSMPGQGQVEFDVDADFASEGEITDSLVLFKTYRFVNCFTLETMITVTFDPEKHTTNYDVQVFHTSESTNYMRTEITDTTRVKYNWSSASTCGTFDNPGDHPYNSYLHEGCNGTEEAAARIGVQISYTADDGRIFKRNYAAAARANEGAGAISF